MATAQELNIQIERITPQRVAEVYEALHESLDDLYPRGISHPELTIEEVEKIAKQFHTEWDLDQTYGFYAVDATTNHLLGVVQLNQVNRFNQMANLFYWVRSSRSGQGIITRAAKLAVKYGFEKLALRRIEIVVQEDNEPSLRVAEKLGARREGLLRNRLLIHGTSYHAYMHSLIPEDME
ncbi:MAG: GNAT family N-acetyltransferase [Anaerolineales bacterium]|nr:GNAT family N-acetyltransferase [Anaerolineales bacterium]